MSTAGTVNTTEGQTTGYETDVFESGEQEHNVTCIANSQFTRIREHSTSFSHTTGMQSEQYRPKGTTGTTTQFPQEITPGKNRRVIDTRLETCINQLLGAVLKH